MSSNLQGPGRQRPTVDWGDERSVAQRPREPQQRQEPETAPAEDHFVEERPRRRSGGVTSVLYAVVLLLLLLLILGGGFLLLVQYGVISLPGDAPAAPARPAAVETPGRPAASTPAPSAAQPVSRPPLAVPTGPATPPPQIRPITVFGGKLADVKSAPGNTAVDGASTAGRPSVLISSTLKTAKTAGLTDGVTVRIPADVVSQIGNRTVKVTIVARGAGPLPSDRFAAAYATGAIGSSPWLVFTPTASFDSYSFTYRVPAGATPSEDFIGIWADVTGQGRGIEVSSVTVETVR